MHWKSDARRMRSVQRRELKSKKSTFLTKVDADTGFSLIQSKLRRVEVILLEKLH